MLKFYKNVSLGIDLINKLGPKSLSVSSLALSLGTTPCNLQRVTRKLSVAGLIKSTTGRGGGLSRIDGDITLKMLFGAFYDDPMDAIQESVKVSSNLNSLYLSFLGAVSIYNEGAALQQFYGAAAPKEEVLDEIPPGTLRRFKEVVMKEEVIEGDIYEEEDLDFNGEW